MKTRIAGILTVALTLFALGACASLRSMIDKGDVEAVRAFDGDLGKPDKEGRSPLVYAIGAGKAEIALLLIEKGAALDGAMDAAIKAGDVEVARALVGRGGSDGTHLAKALRLGRAEIARLLFEAKAFCPGDLAVAIERGDAGFARDLVEAGAFTNADFARAVDAGMREVASLLLAKKAFDAADLDKAIRRHDGDFARALLAAGGPGPKSLAAAIEAGEGELARLVVGAGGASEEGYRLAIERRDAELCGALAAKGLRIKGAAFAFLGKGDAAQLLLAIAAEKDVNAPGPDGGSLLMAAIGKGLGVVRAIAEKGADLNKANSYGETPLNYCVGTKELADRLPIAGFLLDRGADPEIANKGGITPLMRAAYFADADLTKRLIGLAKDPTRRSASGYTVLYFALANVDMLKIILDAGYKPSEKYGSGTTPLMAAAKAGYLKSAEILIERGAPVDEKDDMGLTAYQIAMESKHEDVGALLLAKGATKAPALDLKAKFALIVMDEDYANFAAALKLYFDGDWYGSYVIMYNKVKPSKLGGMIGMLVTSPPSRSALAQMDYTESMDYKLSGFRSDPKLSIILEYLGR